MHEALRRLVDAEYAKAAERLSEANQMKAKQIREDASRRGLIQDSWRPVLNAQLEYAKNLCEERAKVWVNAIERSEGRFEKEDADFVEKEVAVLIEPQRDAAMRDARLSDRGASVPTDVYQLVGGWGVGTIGPIRRDLLLRVEESTLREKERKREREAHLAKSLPWWVQVLLGTAPHHPYSLRVLALTTYFFFTVGALYGLIQLIVLVRKTWWP